MNKIVGQKQMRYSEGKGAVQLEARQKIQMGKQVGVTSQGYEYQAKESENQSLG